MRTHTAKVTMERTEPDYSIDLNDLFEIDMIEAEKEVMRRDYAEGKIKTHPSILFSVEYMTGRQKKDTLYYLQCIGKLKGECRNHMNVNYIKHLNVVLDYENRRSKIKNAFECKKRYPELWKKYRISKICVDRYHRFFKTIWTRPSRKGKLIEQYRCISCGIIMPKGNHAFMCIKCENNESSKFKNRGEWKTNILRKEIDAVSPNIIKFNMSFFEAYQEIRSGFIKKITPLRRKRKQERYRKYYEKLMLNNPPPEKRGNFRREKRSVKKRSFLEEVKP